MALSEDNRKWHIEKGIPIATIAVLAGQTIGFIWWAATLTAKVEANDRAVAVQVMTQAAVDRRQDEEVLRSEARVAVRLDKLDQKLDRLLEKKGP